MNLLFPRLAPPVHLLAIATVVLSSGACKRQEATTYTAPREGDSRATAEDKAPAPEAHADGSPLDATVPSPVTRPPTPRVAWQLPAGWQETGPGQMSAVTFAVKGDAGQATVSVTQLPNLAGQEAMIVNMWRAQAGASELKPEETGSELKPVEISGQPGQLFEISATPKEGKAIRISTAILHRADGSWFFKMQGDDATVSSQREVFLAFLKSFEFEDKGRSSQPAQAAAAATPLPAMSAGPAAAELPSTEPYAAFPTPEGWRPVAAGQMQVAKFAVPTQGAAKAEVAISKFSSDTGGNDANISRWRRQIGLPEISAEELKGLPQPLDAALPGAVVADLQHESKRLVGAIVPREGQWWFYKLMGDAAAVEAARASFLTLAKTAPKS